MEGIARRAGEYDRTATWPGEDLVELRSLRLLDHDRGQSPLDRHLQYEQLATASVATALVLTQRDAAVDLIDGADDGFDRPGFEWTTVGIAQLTTSRQGGQPAVMATVDGDGYRLTGRVPWCTGADHSDGLVVGAATEDRQQILCWVDAGSPGLTIEPPMDLVALSATHTAGVSLDEVRVGSNHVIRRPSGNALSRRSSSLPLGQTFVATGLTRSAINLIGRHDSDTARSTYGKLTESLESLRAEIHDLCRPDRHTAATAANAQLRGACNDLAVRATHAAVAIYKGTALLRSHPAQRLAREAMFLLVWSCPEAVTDCTVELLTDVRSQ